MKISFKNHKLAKTFNSKSLLIREYGFQNARFIMNRMMVLYASPNLSEVPAQKPDRCHQLTGNRKWQFSVDIKHPFRLIFKPDHDPIPRKDDGGLDLNRITAITILGVEDYHK